MKEMGGQGGKRNKYQLLGAELRVCEPLACLMGRTVLGTEWRERGGEAHAH